MGTNNAVRRIFVEKRKGFDVEAQGLFRDLRDNLGVDCLKGVRVVNRYDVAGLTDEEYALARTTIFSEPPVDHVYDEVLPCPAGCRIFAMEYLPGQFDQRADSAAQCIQIITQKEQPKVVSAKVFLLEGDINDTELAKIKNYCINPVESREAAMAKPASLETGAVTGRDVEVIAGFIGKNPAELREFMAETGLAMSFEDLLFCQSYFRDTEKRDPTETELKVIDTYWSDHCRHTTFLTEIEEVTIEDGPFTRPIKAAYSEYLKSREYVYDGAAKRDVCLMDIAVMGMKELKKQGRLNDLDESDEINACSIAVNVDIAGRSEEWLVMFKNETHNHPTEIEPFGGAATCLGGAIRDPLSGRSYVYQAMRVTGSGDPRTPVEATLPGKLPQRKITIGAAAGYSSYGNQIGLATGQVAEIYDEDFVAKRMEIGAVIGAAPRKNIVRQKPVPGDAVILLGGRTGRDGCGGATGSSKEHTEDSLLTCGAEVQKGNPPTERKIQRLFRNPAVSRMIKKCNDFGAGGVSVAIGELTEGVEVNLDLIPKKYEGLDGTELAISESQERMAVVVAAQDADAFIAHAAEENLEATVVARVTADARLKMYWRQRPIVNISRAFLDTNGVRQKTRVLVKAPEAKDFFDSAAENVYPAAGKIAEAWLENLRDLNVCSQRGLVERFDSTIGAGTVLMPFGGIYQATPAEGMVAKIPVENGDTTTATMMTFGYNPCLAKWSPFHGGLYAVVEAVTKAVALGGDYKKIRLSLQEYFEKLGNDPAKWGKPFSALLGAFCAQKAFGIPAIGGKDSMSGTFKDLSVPPTLVAFAVNVVNAERVVSQEFKQSGSAIVLLPAVRDESGVPDFGLLMHNFDKVRELIAAGHVLAAAPVKTGGVAAAVTKMCFGNGIGAAFADNISGKELFRPDYGSIVLELKAGADFADILGDTCHIILGSTTDRPAIQIGGAGIELSEAYAAWSDPLEKVFPTQAGGIFKPLQDFEYRGRSVRRPVVKTAKPRVFIPVFPGTNCEYDSARAFEKAGGIVDTLVFKNLSPQAVEQSIDAMAAKIANAQIIMLAGGFSAGDEPEGSGKFIAAVFRNPKIKESVTEFLNRRDGLMLGICNGFQALIKLGLVPYGEITDLTEDSPTLTFNLIGRHVSAMARTKVVSTLSPWFSNVDVGDIHTIPISHGEGRFVASEELMTKMIAGGQIASRYVDMTGLPSCDIRYNYNGSVEAVEGITSPDGRILGKMGHSERIGANVAVNVPGNKDQRLFEAGISYFS